MRLELSKPALADLDDILRFLSERTQLGAAHVEVRLRRAFAHIARFPEAAQAVEQRPGVRRLPLGRYPYVVYYEIGRDTVTVLRILHGARRQSWEDS